METVLHLIDGQVLAVTLGSNCYFFCKLIFIV